MQAAALMFHCRVVIVFALPEAPSVPSAFSLSLIPLGQEETGLKKLLLSVLFNVRAHFRSRRNATNAPTVSCTVN